MPEFLDGAMILKAFLGILCLVMLFGVFFTVEQQTVVAVERFGKFARFAQAGLNFKIPLIEEASRGLSLRVFHETIIVETKTLDNVFVKLHLTVQYYMLPDKLMDAFYKPSNLVAQMTAYVQDIVRGQVPKMDLDHVFVNKDSIAQAVQDSLADAMTGFGYGIQSTQVTEVNPDEKVVESMNSINAARRDCAAATERGEAERILLVAKATAEAESKALQGKGIADQRKALIAGLQESVELFQKAIPGATADDVMKLVLMTQYLDTMKDVGASSRSNMVFMNSSAGAMDEMMQQIAAMVRSPAPSQHDAGGNGHATTAKA